MEIKVREWGLCKWINLIRVFFNWVWGIMVFIKLCFNRYLEVWKFLGSFLWIVCLIICCLVKFIVVFGLVIIIFLSMVKFVVILFVVGWVKIGIYSCLVFLCCFRVLEILVICIRFKRFFCILVLLEV